MKKERKMKSKGWFALMVLAVALGGLLLVGCDRATKEKFPTKPIEFVISSAAGGSNDIAGRNIANMIDKNKLMPVPITVVNKPGGSSGVAKAYLSEKSRDAHVWLIAGSAFLTSYIRGESKLSYKDFTPISLLVEDSILLVVRNDSPYKSFTDVINAAKKNPKKVNFAGGQVGNDDHILMYNIQKAAGVELNFVAIDAGELMANLLGGHVDLISINPQEAVGQIQAKKVRPLVVSSLSRLPSLPDVPTLKDLGINASHAQYRGVVTTKDVPKETATYLDGVLKKVIDTPEWQKYLKDGDMISKYLGPDEYGKFLASESDKFQEAMVGLGLVKK